MQAGNTRMYVFSAGLTDSSGFTGSLLPPSERANRDRFLSIPFSVKVGETADIYLKTYRRQTGITFTPLLEDPSKLVSHVWLDYLMVFGLSLLFVILLVSFHISIAYPSKSSLWFSAYILSTFFYTLSASGYGSLFIWGNYPAFEENSAVLIGAVATTCMFELCRSVFDMKNQYRRLNGFLLFYTAVNILCCISGIVLLFFDITVSAYSVAMGLLYLLGILGYVGIFHASFREAFTRKRSEYRLFVFLIGFVLSLIFVIILLETGKLSFSYQLHSLILSIGPIPQTIVPLVFFINRILHNLEEKQRQVTEAKFIGEQNLLRERLRVSQQLHDDIGGTLSGVNMYSYMAESLFEQNEKDKVRESLHVIQRGTGEVVDKLKDLVWSVKQESDSVDTMLERIEQYGMEICKARDIHFEMKVGNVKGYESFPGEYRYKLYLLIKEAINNAVKHSGASTVTLNFSIVNRVLMICIEDDGIGLDMSNVGKGNGISNMYRTAEEMNATFNINSEKGTLLEIKISIDG
ncbi:MAG: hypothetical protein JST02_04465 [Bacteroidetes bacterium]|nr:hypothetical protein [Bacteroidota bacterium]